MPIMQPAGAAKVFCFGCASGFPTEENPEEGIVHRAKLGTSGMDEIFHCIAACPDSEEAATIKRIADALHAAYAAGAEAMREAAVSALERLPEPEAFDSNVISASGRRVRGAISRKQAFDAILALPIPPRPSGGETCPHGFPPNYPDCCYPAEPSGGKPQEPLGHEFREWTEPTMGGQTIRYGGACKLCGRARSAHARQE